MDSSVRAWDSLASINVRLANAINADAFLLEHADSSNDTGSLETGLLNVRIVPVQFSIGINLVSDTEF